MFCLGLPPIVGAGLMSQGLQQNLASLQDRANQGQRLQANNAVARQRIAQLSGAGNMTIPARARALQQELEGLRQDRQQRREAAAAGGITLSQVGEDSYSNLGRSVINQLKDLARRDGTFIVADDGTVYPTGQHPPIPNPDPNGGGRAVPLPRVAPRNGNQTLRPGSAPGFTPLPNVLSGGLDTPWEWLRLPSRSAGLSDLSHLPNDHLFAIANGEM